MANWQQLSGFDCIVDDSNDSDTCIVLYHGYGADAGDLHPLKDYLDSESKFHWVFPQGVQEVILAPGMTGRAWFDIDVQAMEKAMVTGSYRDLASTRPKNLDQIAELSADFLTDLQAKYKKIIIGGFSQGAMLSTETLLTAKKKPQGLIVLSGTMLSEENWRSWAGGVEGIPLFQSHGHTDALLDPKQALKLYQFLKESGMDAKLCQFNGGHEIPLEVLGELRNFLKKHFGS